MPLRLAASETRVGGRVLHVAPHGKDEDGPARGTFEHPFATLPHAYARAAAGDTILMRGGTYGFEGAQSGWILAGGGGTPGAPVKIVSYPGQTPIIDGAAMTPAVGESEAWPSSHTAGGFPLVLWDTSYVELHGLTVRNGPMGGIHVNGTHHAVLLERCISRDNGWLNDEHGVGIGIYGSGNDNVIRNCDSFGNHGGGAGAHGGNADGFQIFLRESTGTKIIGNRAWRNTDDGFDFFNVSHESVTGSPYLVDQNWSFENGFFATGSMNDDPQADGNGFKLGGRRPKSNGTHGGHTVTRCVAWNNKTNGFDENGTVQGTEPHTVFNNISFNNARNTNRQHGDIGYAFIFDYQPATVLRNNVALATTGRNAVHVQLTVNSHNVRNGVQWNSFHPPITLSESDFASLDDQAARGPRAADGSLPVSGFLRPSKRSQLIGRGSTAGLPSTIRFPGEAPDLGAFSFE